MRFRQIESGGAKARLQRVGEAAAVRPMPRKFFRKYLPSHEAVRRNRYIAFLGAALHHPNLWHLNRHSAAGGFAVGMFCGLVPGPFQMLSAALLAVMLRVNLPVAIVATLYTNPLTIVPLYYLAYQLGLLATGHGTAQSPPPALDLGFANMGEWMGLLIAWIGAMGRPFLLGLLLLASSLAVGGYIAVRGAWRLHVILAWRRRARRRGGAAD